MRHLILIGLLTLLCCLSLPGRGNASNCVVFNCLAQRYEQSGSRGPNEIANHTLLETTRALGPEDCGDGNRCSGDKCVFAGPPSSTVCTSGGGRCFVMFCN